MTNLRKSTKFSSLLTKLVSRVLQSTLEVISQERNGFYTLSEIGQQSVEQLDRPTRVCSIWHARLVLYWSNFKKRVETGSLRPDPSGHHRHTVQYQSTKNICRKFLSLTVQEKLLRLPSIHQILSLSNQTEGQALNKRRKKSSPTPDEAVHGRSTKQAVTAVKRPHGGSSRERYCIYFLKTRRVHLFEKDSTLSLASQRHFRTLPRLDLVRSANIRRSRALIGESGTVSQQTSKTRVMVSRL